MAVKIRVFSLRYPLVWLAIAIVAIAAYLWLADETVPNQAYDECVAVAKDSVSPHHEDCSVFK